MNDLVEKTKGMQSRAKTAKKNKKKIAEFNKASKLNQLEMFVADFVDASAKGDDASMMIPFFALSKKKDMTARAYRDKNGEEVLRLEPSGRGLATIWDKDILIYAMGQIMKAIAKDEMIGRKIKIEAYSILKATKGSASQASYENIEDSLVRLRGTTVLTTIPTGGVTITDGFGFIEDFRIVSKGKKRLLERKSEERDKEGYRKTVMVPKQAVLSFEITLSEWLYNALLHAEVQMIDCEYFKISGGIKRRLYEISKKHTGDQDHWSVYLKTLFRKSGVKHSDLDPEIKENKTNYRNALKKFRAEVKVIAKDNDLPRYFITYNVEDDQVVFENRRVAN